MNRSNTLEAHSRKPGAVFLTPVLVVAALVIAVLVSSERKAAVQALVEVPRRELILREGRLYKGDDTAPFTGIVTELYEGGGLKSRSVVSNGLLEGLSEGWYTNGQKQVEEHFHAGVSHGVRTKWYASGARLSESMIVDGQLHGTFQRWHQNGRLSEQVEISHGQPTGLSLAYHPDGSLKARVKLENGKVLEQEWWPDKALGR